MPYRLQAKHARGGCLQELFRRGQEGHVMRICQSCNLLQHLVHVSEGLLTHYVNEVFAHGLGLDVCFALLTWCAPEPDEAAHSRRALMQISRLMTRMTGTAKARCVRGAGGVTASKMSAVLTMSLSATGSRKAPKAVVSFICQGLAATDIRALRCRVEGTYVSHWQPALQSTLQRRMQCSTNYSKL